MAALLGFPGCCSVDVMYGFYGLEPYIPNSSGKASRHFVAVFSEHQKPGFDACCKKHTPKSVVVAPGSHGARLAICIFKFGKK